MKRERITHVYLCLLGCHTALVKIFQNVEVWVCSWIEIVKECAQFEERWNHTKHKKFSIPYYSNTYSTIQITRSAFAYSGSVESNNENEKKSVFFCFGSRSRNKLHNCYAVFGIDGGFFYLYRLLHHAF